MYVAPRPDWDWLQSEQRRLYARSENQVDYVFCKLWGLVTDPRNLRMALARVAGNRGRRTAGVDGITVGGVVKRVLSDNYISPTTTITSPRFWARR
jgi:retron-type reverse transcriptase